MAHAMHLALEAGKLHPVRANPKEALRNRFQPVRGRYQLYSRRMTPALDFAQEEMHHFPPLPVDGEHGSLSSIG